MFQMGIDHLVREMTPYLLGEDWRKFGKGLNEIKKCVYYRFDCRISDNVNDVRDSRVIHIIVTQHHECFYVVNKSYSAGVNEFIFSSAHDSCWCEMPFINKTYFDLCKAVNDDVAPKDLQQNCWFMQNIIVGYCQTEKDKEDERGYKRKFKSFFNKSLS